MEVELRFDEYYANLLRRSLSVACPSAAALFVAFYGWDWLIATTRNQLLWTGVLRLLFAAITLSLWASINRLKTANQFSLVLGAIYLVGLLDLIAILIILPNGVEQGLPGMLIVTMFATGIFRLRAIVAIPVGFIGLAALEGAAFAEGYGLQQLVSFGVFFGSGVIVSGIFLIFVEHELRDKHRLLLDIAEEKSLSESLLNEILPDFVVQRIRAGEKTIADSLSEVNVIFIDLVGFTSLSKQLSPGHLVEVLGRVFHAFDDLCDAHGVTKIKTIGDAYMAATGAPQEDQASASDAVRFCQEAIGIVRDVSEDTGLSIEVRCGIATGALVSGVLSLKRPAYDLWGDTVNLAARMESSGVTGRINVAETTFWRIRGDFPCEKRERITVKGFGEIDTYLVQEGCART